MSWRVSVYSYGVFFKAIAADFGVVGKLSYGWLSDRFGAVLGLMCPGYLFKFFGLYLIAALAIAFNRQSAKTVT